MSSQVFYISSLLLALIGKKKPDKQLIEIFHYFAGLAASQGVDQDDVDRQGYANSVYDNEAYNYGYYDQGKNILNHKPSLTTDCSPIWSFNIWLLMKIIIFCEEDCCWLLTVLNDLNWVVSSDDADYYSNQRKYGTLER